MLGCETATEEAPVVFPPEPFWTAADSVLLEAFGGMSPLRFCPHHCIPGMPFTGLRWII